MPKRIEVLKWQKPEKPRQRLNFVVPIPPSSNDAFWGGRRGIKTSAKLWMSRCKAYVLEVIEKSGWINEPDEVWFYIDMVFYFP